jgi:hypothetical protein
MHPWIEIALASCVVTVASVSGWNWRHRPKPTPEDVLAGNAWAQWMAPSPVCAMCRTLAGAAGRVSDVGATAEKERRELAMLGGLVLGIGLGRGSILALCDRHLEDARTAAAGVATKERARGL